MGARRGGHARHLSCARVGGRGRGTADWGEGWELTVLWWGGQHSEARTVPGWTEGALVDS